MLPPFHTHPLLDSPAIAHGFFGRKGGVSAGLYAGLNCGLGSRDRQTDVAENRARVTLALAMPPEKLCTLYQVHSAEAVVVRAPWDGTPPEADALVSNIAGLTLGILTADCAPILLADHAAGVIGAAHAGWKGAVHGVIESTLRAMETLGATRAGIAAVVGPCIAQASYEVGDEFRARFAVSEQSRFFIPGARADHYQFDLPAYVAARLRDTGLQRVAILAMDTASDPGQFFSYRRATLRAEPDYGRQISAIGLRP
ncbi:MAG: peptidoglycan editing factor PgeF [Alphaproteobacteria bacterium]|nr:peptidoglycan editing factor PgeF [Alphaproteobacteria bacterium]